MHGLPLVREASLFGAQVAESHDGFLSPIVINLSYKIPILKRNKAQQFEMI